MLSFYPINSLFTKDEVSLAFITTIFKKHYNLNNFPKNKLILFLTFICNIIGALVLLLRFLYAVHTVLEIFRKSSLVFELLSLNFFIQHRTFFGNNFCIKVYHLFVVDVIAVDTNSFIAIVAVVLPFKNIFFKKR